MDQEQAPEVTVRELRTSLADILNDVSARGKTVYITNRGRRIAALVPLAVAEQDQPESATGR